MASEKNDNVLKKYIIFADSDIKTVKVFTYGITSLCLGIALYQVKPFIKFRKPSSIPSRFLCKKVVLQGTVKHIQSTSSTLLMVDHHPLIPLPQLYTSKHLPIKIAGLNVTPTGINWLRAITYGKTINFIPLVKNKDYVSCIVYMQQKQECINIGEELAKIGFAVVEDNSINTMTKDKDILNYAKRLLNAQKSAQRKRNGYWHFVREPTPLWKLQQNLSGKLKLIVPKFITHLFST